ncbi:hypothetical protein LMG27198_46480 [Methylocystis echinoides]|uniref:Uncharacterized protein n=1 Tax=Methylocystis echinoides TaxID=29468 RepID=A0A9W6GZ83_9HYPH|nr:hypothetical protein LMG27198_46480 [Methylocystis echinoides]
MTAGVFWAAHANNATNPARRPIAWPTIVFQILAPDALGVTACIKTVGPRLGKSQGSSNDIAKDPIAPMTNPEIIAG